MRRVCVPLSTRGLRRGLFSDAASPLNLERFVLLVREGYVAGRAGTPSSILLTRRSLPETLRFR